MSSERFLKSIKTRGKNLIILASENQLEIDKTAEEINKVSFYGSSHIFEIALRLIGENNLADEFMVEDYNIDDLLRSANNSKSCLHAAIAHLYSGKENLALNIMEEHKSKYHVHGIGFLYPHSIPDGGEDLEKGKKILVELLKDGSLLENLTLVREHIDPISNEKEPSVAKAYFKSLVQLKYGKNCPSTLTGFLFNSNFKASVPETVYSMLMHHMLGKNEEADRLYNESRYFQERYYARDDPIPLRALALIGYPTAQKRHEMVDPSIFFKDSHVSIHHATSLIARDIFHLDQFNEERLAYQGRKKLYALSTKLEEEMKKEKGQDKIIDYGNSTFIHDACLIAGMALVGLGKSHARYFF